MDGATSGVDRQQGPSKISSHSEGGYNEKNIQDLLSQLLVAASKMKEHHPPVEGIQSGLRMATDSEWSHNISWGNYKELLAQLQADPCLVVQTDDEGYTVLHVAARAGCVQLVKHVYDLFKSTVKFVDEQSGINITWWELVDAKHGEHEAQAADYALHTSRILYQFFSKQDRIDRDRNFLTEDPMQTSSSDENEHLRNEVLKIMQEESIKEAFKYIEKDYEKVKLGDEPEELRFHYAAELTGLNSDSIEYVVDVITKCLQLADAKGWTTLHHAAATDNDDDLEVLLKDERVDVNIRTSEHVAESDNAKKIEKQDPRGKTALHLAILHGHVKCVKLLLNCSRIDVNALLERWIVCGYRTLGESDYYWSPLQLAAIMGLSNIVRILLESPKLPVIFDDGKFSNSIAVPNKNFRRISALLLASASGNPDTLRLFLDNPKFNPLVKFHGATALHYASNASMPYSISMYVKRPIRISNGQVNVFLFDHDFSYVEEDFKLKSLELSHMKEQLTSTLYLVNQACITMLLQAGVDIWEKDDQGRFAEPGPAATQEARLWWYNRIAQETSEAKKSLNDAANAISVVAALVATASFVGPLQPPLGYGEDTNLSVRVFMVSNNFSFYLAIASIVFALAPPLPMRQEGIYTEWQRARRAVGMALSFLLMSVLGVLISFAAASNSIVSEEYSWKHGGLSFYPTLIGGLICMISISLFFLRLLRLVFNKSETNRWLYKTFVKF